MNTVLKTLDIGSASTWKPPSMDYNPAAQMQATALGMGNCYECDSEKKTLAKDITVRVPSQRLPPDNFEIVNQSQAHGETYQPQADNGSNYVRLTANARVEEELLDTAHLVETVPKAGGCSEDVPPPPPHRLENGEEAWRSAEQALVEPTGTSKPFYLRVEDIPVVLSRSDQKMRYMVVYNWDENYDWIPQSEWIGHTDQDLMPGIDGAEALYEHKVTCYRTGSVQKREICLTDVPNYGTQVWLVMTWADVKSDRDVAGVYAACVEVTEIALQREYLGSLHPDSPARRGAIEKLEIMVDMTAAALETRAACLASAMFKIRAPLDGVFGAADALARMPLTREQRGLLRLVRTSGEALLELARGALAQDVVVGGHIQVMNKVFCPAVIVERAVQDTWATAECPGVSFDTDIDEQVPHKVIGDSLLLLQSLQILVRHVACEMQSGNVCVRLRLAAFSPSPSNGIADSSSGGNFDTVPSPRLPLPPLWNGRGQEMISCRGKRQKVEADEGAASEQATGNGEEELVKARPLVDCQLSLAPPGSSRVHHFVTSTNRPPHGTAHGTAPVGVKKRNSSGKRVQVAGSEAGVQSLWEENATLLRFDITESVPESNIAEEQAPRGETDVSLELPVPRPVGSELGLCRRLVRLMGGMLHANSIPGRRITYNFTIPFKAVTCSGHSKSPPVCSPRASIAPVSDRSLPPPGFVSSHNPRARGISAFPRLSPARPPEPLDVPGLRDAQSRALLPIPCNRQRESAAGMGMGRRVLLVEKNAEEAQFLTAILHELGLEIQLVSSALQALHALASSPFDLLLVDEDVLDNRHSGGSYSSLESVCVAVRDAHKGSGVEWLPIVAIRDSSLLTAGQNKRPSLVEGVDAFIAKPATLYKVQLVVQEFFGKIC